MFHSTTTNEDSDELQSPFSVFCFNQLYDSHIEGHYCKGYVNGKENLQKFENDLRMETNQKFSVSSGHSRESKSTAKKKRYSEDGYVNGKENLQKFENDLRMETNQKFSVSSGHSRESKSTAKKKRYSEDGKLRWKSDIGDIHIPFSGVPFVLQSVYQKECLYGVDYHHSGPERGNGDESNQDPNHHHSYDKRGKKRIILQGTRKRDCPASLSVREITVFPDYDISPQAKEKNAWQLRKLKKETLEKLRGDLANGDVKSINRFYVQAPTKEAHKHHNLDSEINISALPIHQDLILKIRELVNQGIDSVREVKHILRDYVLNVMFKDNAKKPDYANQGYFPTDRNIRNHINRSIALNRYSKIDQENFMEKVKEWREASPNSMFFFRPSATEASDNDTGSCDISKKLLYIHQSQWQRRLLERYGQVVLLDATYKTMSYALPLFFLCVKTNLSYIVVGEFVIEDEQIESISEALEIIKKWNPDWNAVNFMTDFSEAEISSLESVFPGATVLLCDFHRGQAWDRWLKRNSNALSQGEQKVAISLMRQIANATTEVGMDAAITKMKSSDIWQKNEHLRSYMNSKWLPNKERWVKFFRMDKMADMIINTNNGVESQNRTLKHSFLKHHSDKSLTGVIGIILQQFLPEQYRNYCRDNGKMSSEHRPYKDAVSAFLHNRPHQFIKHVESKIFAARDFAAKDVNAIDFQLGVFEVLSMAAGDPCIWYVVDFTRPSCQCPDWERYRYPCKHFCAVFHHHPEWSFQQLPNWYRISPYFTLDTESRQSEVDDLAKVDMKEDQATEKVKDDQPTGCVKDDLNDLGADIGILPETDEDTLPSDKDDPDSNRSMLKPLPPLRRFNVKRSRAFCCAALQNATSAAYLCHEKEVLQKATDMANAITALLHNVSTTDETSTLLLNPKSKKIRRRKIGVKNKLHAQSNNLVLKSLKKYQPPNKKIWQHKRHGARADMMREHYKVHVPVHVPPKTEYKTEVAPKSSMQEPNIVPPPKPLKESANKVATGRSQTWIDGKVGIRLTLNDRSCLLSKKWLNDAHITAAQNILSDQFPLISSLQSPIKAPNFDPVPGQAEFVQILNTGGNHWLTISNIGRKENEVSIYDSLYSHVPQDTKVNALQLMRPRGGQLTLYLERMEKQKNGHDCGLYAIAFATALCHGSNPCQFTLDEQQLRTHLAKCFENQKMEPFPVIGPIKTNGQMTCIKADNVTGCPTCQKPLYLKEARKCVGCNMMFHIKCTIVVTISNVVKCIHCLNYAVTGRRY